MLHNQNKKIEKIIIFFSNFFVDFDYVVIHSKLVILKFFENEYKK